MTDTAKTTPAPEGEDRLAAERGCDQDSLENIIAQLDAKYPEWEDACKESEPENFCKECPYMEIVSDRQEYWGAICYREYPHCKAEFDPTDGNCRRKEEYAEITEYQDKLKGEIIKLEDLFERLEEKEGETV